MANAKIQKLKTNRDPARSKPTLSEALPDRIVHAALTLLEHKSLHELTYRDIAAQAGVSHMAPYRYFKTIEEIFFRINEEGDRLLKKTIQEAMDKFPLDPERQILEVGILYFEFAIENRTRFLITMSEYCGNKNNDKNKEAVQRLLEARRETFGVFLQMIRNCQLKGVLPEKKNSEELAFTLWSFIHGLVTLHLHGHSGLLKSSFDPRQSITKGIKSILYGLNK
jgi:AcrR family transcriptional regulator